MASNVSQLTYSVLYPVHYMDQLVYVVFTNPLSFTPLDSFSHFIWMSKSSQILVCNSALSSALTLINQLNPLSPFFYKYQIKTHFALEASFCLPAHQ